MVAFIISHTKKIIPELLQFILSEVISGGLFALQIFRVRSFSNDISLSMISTGRAILIVPPQGFYVQGKLKGNAKKPEKVMSELKRMKGIIKIL